MKTLSLSLKFFVFAVFTFALASTAQAQVRTWVSGDGNDFDPCSRTAPCRTFAGAIGKTSAGGEINVMDAGSYGTVTIAKAITIDGNGFVAAITATISNGVNINGDMADTVTLRNISINGQFAAFNGINYTATTNGSQLVLENVTIERMGTSGIFVQGGSAANPLLVEINNCQLNNNFVGIQQRQHSAVNMRNSVITGQLHKGGNSFGVNLTPQAGTAASIKLENNEISYCQSALRAIGTDLGGGTPTLWIRGNHIYRNTYGANFTVNVSYFTDLSNKLSDNTNNVVGGTAFAIPSM